MVSRLRIGGTEGPLEGTVPLPSDELVLCARLAVASLARGTTTIESKEPSGGALALARGIDATLTSVTHEAGRFTVVGAGLVADGKEAAVLDLRGEILAAAYLVALTVGRTRGFSFLVDRALGETLGGLLASLDLATVRSFGDDVELETRSRGERTSGFEVELEGRLPWLKGPLLLIALRANSPSEILEGVFSADHVERALMRGRAPLFATGTNVTVHPPRDADALAPNLYEDIGSVEAAAYLSALALGIPGSAITTKVVASNPTRFDYFSLVRLLGGAIDVAPRGDRQGEPFADVTTRFGRLRPTVLEGEQCARLSDATLPLLAAFARSPGEFVLNGAFPTGRDANPRILSRAIGILKNAGVDAALHDENVLIVRGSERPLAPLKVTSGGDPRLVLLASVLALSAQGESVIDNVDCLRERFPRWVGTLRALGAKVVVEEAEA